MTAQRGARVALIACAEGTKVMIRTRHAGVELTWTRAGSRSTIPTMAAERSRAAKVGIERAIHRFPLDERSGIGQGQGLRFGT